MPAQVLTLDDFTGGIDRRHGMYQTGKKRVTFRRLVNYWPGRDRFLHRRPPFTEMEGLLDSDSQGLFYANGELVTFAKQGDSITHTDDVDTNVTTKYFDAPPNSTTWTLLDAAIYEDTLVALIRHTYPCTTAPDLVYLHVFDDHARYLTWVSDPSVPASAGITLASITDTLTHDPNWSPRLTVCGGKLCIPRTDGNVGFSAAGLPRTWNERTNTDIRDSGEHVMYVMPDHSNGTVVEFVLPFLFDDLAWIDDDSSNEKTYRYWSYVLQYWDGTNWVEFDEVTNTSGISDEEWVLEDDGPQGRASIRWDGSSGKVIRFKAIRGVHQDGVPSDSATEFTSGSGYVSLLDDTEFTQWLSTFNSSEVVHNVTDDDTWKAMLLSENVAPYPEEDAFGAAGSGTVSFVVAFANIGENSGDVIFTGQQRYRHPVVTGLSVKNDGGTITFSDASGGGEAFTADDPWHDQMIETEAALAGANDAGFLPTARHEPNGEQVGILGAVRDRLIVIYPNSAQLWAFPSTPSDAALLDTAPFGCGEAGRPTGVRAFDALITPTLTGWHAWDTRGQDWDALSETNVGDPVDLIHGAQDDWTQVTMRHAVFWPYLGHYVALGIQDGDAVMSVLALSRRDKLSAWATYTFEGVSDWDMVGAAVVEERLYARSEQSINYLDATLATYKDSADGATAYESLADPHYFDMGSPRSRKRIKYLDIAQIGTCSVTFKQNATDDSEETDALTLEGLSYDQRQIRVPMRCQSVAPMIRSTDESGHVLQMLSLEFSQGRR